MMTIGLIATLSRYPADQKLGRTFKGPFWDSEKEGIYFVEVKGDSTVGDWLKVAGLQVSYFDDDLSHRLRTNGHENVYISYPDDPNRDPLTERLLKAWLGDPPEVLHDSYVAPQYRFSLVSIGKGSAI